MARPRHAGPGVSYAAAGGDGALPLRPQSDVLRCDQHDPWPRPAVRRRARDRLRRCRLAGIPFVCADLRGADAAPNLRRRIQGFLFRGAAMDTKAKPVAGWELKGWNFPSYIEPGTFFPNFFFTSFFKF